MTCRTAAMICASLVSSDLAFGQISLRDDLGRSVTLPSPAQCIVSLAPSITETLFAIGAGDQVCGVTDQCTFPPATRQKSHVGGMTNPSVEAIIGLHPDLIVMSMEGNTRPDFDRLTSLGVTVFVTNPRSLQGIRQSIEALGVLTGHAEIAAKINAAISAREDSVSRWSAGVRRRVLLLISIDPLIAVGKHTFIDDLLRRAGGDNVAATAPGNYPALSREAVLSANPAVIIITDDLAPDVSTLLRHFPEWGQLEAAHEGRIYRIDSDLISRPGPRAIDGLERLSQYFHPPRQ